MSKTALIILTYNNTRDTLNCIESIGRHNTAPVKIIVVDNGSTPEHQQALSDGMRQHPEVTLIETGENLGYGKGNNVGLAAAYADPQIDHVMILNNDILFVEDIIPLLIDALDQRPDAAIVSPVLYTQGLKEYDLNCARRNVRVRDLIYDNLFYYLRRLGGKRLCDLDGWRYILKGTGRRGEDSPLSQPHERLLEIELPSGSCMLCRKEVMKELGSFDPATFMYFEENILYKKTQRAGLKNYLALDCRCIHLGAATTTNIPDNRALVRHAKDSETYYVAAYSGAPSWQRWLHRLSVSIYMATYDIQKYMKKYLRNFLKPRQK